MKASLSLYHMHAMRMGAYGYNQMLTCDISGMGGMPTWHANAEWNAIFCAFYYLVTATATPPALSPAHIHALFLKTKPKSRGAPISVSYLLHTSSLKLQVSTGLQHYDRTYDRRLRRRNVGDGRERWWGREINGKGVVKTVRRHGRNLK